MCHKKKKQEDDRNRREWFSVGCDVAKGTKKLSMTQSTDFLYMQEEKLIPESESNSLSDGMTGISNHQLDFCYLVAVFFTTVFVFCLVFLLL